MILSDPAALPVLWGYGYRLVEFSFHLYHSIRAMRRWGYLRDRALSLLPDQISCLELKQCFRGRKALRPDKSFPHLDIVELKPFLGFSPKFLRFLDNKGSITQFLFLCGLRGVL